MHALLNRNIGPCVVALISLGAAGLAAAGCYVQEPPVLTCNQHQETCGTAPQKWQCTFFTDGGAGWMRDIMNSAKAGVSGHTKFTQTQGNCTETYGGCGTWAVQCPAGTPYTTHPISSTVDTTSPTCVGI